MLFIAGAGGFGRETYDAVLSQNGITGETLEPDSIRFIDHKLAGRNVRDISVVSPSEATPGANYVVAIADPAARIRFVTELTQVGLTPVSVFHKAAIFGPESEHGVGSIFLALSHVSSSVKIGNHVHVNYCVTIGHDTVLEDFVTVLPGANVAGSVLIQEGATIGSGAVILPGLVVGEYATVGAGAVVTRNVAARSVVKGVPAR